MQCSGEKRTFLINVTGQLDTYIKGEKKGKKKNQS